MVWFSLVTFVIIYICNDDNDDDIVRYKAFSPLAPPRGILSKLYAKITSSGGKWG